MNNLPKRDPVVVVIGAGMAGILTTIKLREAGIKDIIVLEKAHAVGGTWRENTYPGVSCDVPAHMYAYSFEPYVDWDERFAMGGQIQTYFQKVADKYGVTQTVRFNEAVTSSIYQNGRWYLKTSKGASIVADFVISATGILHHPKYPDIPGLDSFQGAKFHTARWDHNVDCHGKNVGIIGTGSTSVQVIPEMVKVARKVNVFQRTAQWIYPRPDATYSKLYKKLVARFPSLATLIGRLWAFFYAQVFARVVIGKRLQFTLVSWLVKRYLKKSVKDPELRAKLTPDYRIGCKRMVLSSDFFDAIQQPNCELVTEGIDHIESDAVVTKDGTRHELDVLILATGFHHFNFMRPMELIGKDNITIDQVWEQQYINYRSVTIPHFPNFFLLTGPNSPIGNYSVTKIAEVQVDYVLKLIDLWRNQECDEIEPKESAANEFLKKIKGAMGKTVWTGGCQSWYLDQSGNPVLWPFTFEQWVKEMREPQLAHFNLEKVEQEELMPQPQAAVN